MSMFNGTLYASAPPEGVEPDPNAPYQATSIIVITYVFMPLAFVATAIRMYTRGFIVKRLSMDDYLMTGAMICSIVMAAFVLNLLNWGLGKNLWNVPITPDFLPNFGLSNVIAAIFFCAATGLAKGSILLFYLRIFPSKTFHWVVWGFFAFTIGYSAASVFVNIFSCNPVRGSWDFDVATTAVCINRPAFYFAQASFGIFTDLATVLCPLPVLRGLKMPLKQKIAVGTMLTMGGFVCVVSIIRLQSLQVLLTQADLTMNTVPALMWCVLEINLSIIGGCIPAFKPFVQQFFPRFLHSSANASSTAYPYNSRPYPSSGTRTHNAGNTQGTSKTTTEVNSSPAGSEEYIMLEDRHGIKKTVEYGFDVHSKDQTR